MLKDILVSPNISLRFYHVIMIFFGVFMTGITVYNADTSNASPDTSNNSKTNIDTFTDASEFRQDISGKYTNPKYDIIEFQIPIGWYATESMNGDKGIILTMLPGTTEEFFTNLNSLSNNETLPIMNLVVQDKEDLKRTTNVILFVWTVIFFYQVHRN